MSDALSIQRVVILRSNVHRILISIILVVIRGRTEITIHPCSNLCTFQVHKGKRCRRWKYPLKSSSSPFLPMLSYPNSHPPRVEKDPQNKHTPALSTLSVLKLSYVNCLSCLSNLTQTSPHIRQVITNMSWREKQVRLEDSQESIII